MRKTIKALSMMAALASGYAVADEATLKALQAQNVKMSPEVEKQVLDAKNDKDTQAAIEAVVTGLGSLDSAALDAAIKSITTALLNTGMSQAKAANLVTFAAIKMNLDQAVVQVAIADAIVNQSLTPGNTSQKNTNSIPEGGSGTGGDNDPSPAGSV